jgi:hypothetical protein
VLADLRTDVSAVVAEMPKNGVPLATKIDALWSKHLAEQAAFAAAAAQGQLAGGGPTVLIQQGAQVTPAGDPPSDSSGAA